MSSDSAARGDVYEADTSVACPNGCGRQAFGRALCSTGGTHVLRRAPGRAPDTKRFCAGDVICWRDLHCPLCGTIVEPTYLRNQSTSSGGNTPA